jgi:hypothetical protein
VLGLRTKKSAVIGGLYSLLLGMTGGAMQHGDATAALIIVLLGVVIACLIVAWPMITRLKNEKQFAAEVERWVLEKTTK